MSARQLAELDAERAFYPRGRFHELPLDYVPFDELTGSSSVDGRIERAIRAEAGCVSVVAPSGGGKSAAIAAALEQLKEAFPAVRIPVAGAAVAGDPVAFGQHILRETVRHATSLLAAHQRRDLRRASADRLVRRGGAAGAGAKLKALLPGVSVELAADLKSSAIDEEEPANATQVIDALDRLVGIFEGRGGPPILVFEDTDAWLASPDDGRDPREADGFFGRSLGVLMRDVEIRSVVATHTRYVTLAGYQAIRDRLLSEVAIPTLPEPREALSRILQKRIDVSEVEAVVDDVVTPAGVTRLVAEYDHSGRNIRRVLLVCDTALEQCAPTFPERLTEEHLRGAAVALGRQW